MIFAALSEILSRELGPDLAARACSVLCREASGESVYIPARPSPPEIAPTDTPKRVAARYGVALSTAYCWMRRNRARSGNPK